MPGMGSIIDQIWELREAKREREAEIKELERDINTLSEELMQSMDAEGISKATGAKASVSVSELVKPSVEDWDVFYAFIHKNQYFHLLERRPSVTGCRELFETKGAVPGVVPYVKRKVNLRTLK